MATWSFIVVSEHTERGVTLVTWPLARPYLATVVLEVLHSSPTVSPAPAPGTLLLLLLLLLLRSQPPHNISAAGTRDGMSGNLIRLPPAPHHLLIYTRQQDGSWPGQPPAARGKMFQYCAGARPPCGLLPKLVCCICCVFVVRSLYRDTVLAAAAAARANIIHHHKLNLQIEFSAFMQ